MGVNCQASTVPTGHDKILLTDCFVVIVFLVSYAKRQQCAVFCFVLFFLVCFFNKVKNAVKNWKKVPQVSLACDANTLVTCFGEY